MAEAGPEAAVQAAAALGVTGAPGWILVGPHTEDLAAPLSGMVGPARVVAVHTRRLDVPSPSGVSRIRVGQTSPFFHATFSGIVLDGALPSVWRPEELARHVVPGGRIAVMRPGPELRAQWMNTETEPVLDAPEALVVRTRGLR